MKKKYFTKIMALAMTASMLICGNVNVMAAEEIEKESAIDPDKEYTLSFWDINSAETDSKYQARQKAMEEMQELYPNVKIETSYFQDSQYREKLPVAAAANELPDLFFNWIGTTTTSLVDAGKILDLTPYEETLTPNWEDSVVDSCYSDGKLYYMPSGLQAYLLYCNEDLLKENGLEVPGTYNELLNVIKVLSDKGITPMVTGGKDMYPVAILQEIIQLRLDGSEAMLKEIAGDESFDNEKTVKSAEMLAELNASGGFPKNALSMDSNEAYAQFLYGNAAMMYAGNWYAGMLDSEEKDFNVKAVNFPSIEGEIDPNAMLGGPCDIYMINSATEEPDVTVEWMTEFMKHFMKYEVEEAGCISGWKLDDVDTSNIGDVTKQQNEVFATAGDMIRNWDILIDLEKASVLYSKICEVFSGQSDPAAFGADFESIVR